VLAERFHEGPQYSVEAFSQAAEHAVVAITRKYSDRESMVELGHVLPAPLNDDTQATIRDYVVRMLDALGVEFGPTNTEIVLAADGPRIIETHLRVGGDDIFDLVKDATGVDLVDLQVRQPSAGCPSSSASAPPRRRIWSDSPSGRGGTSVARGSGRATVPTRALFRAGVSWCRPRRSGSGRR
jgi:hypothetical protein